MGRWLVSWYLPDDDDERDHDGDDKCDANFDLHSNSYVFDLREDALAFVQEHLDGHKVQEWVDGDTDFYVAVDDDGDAIQSFTLRELKEE